jgi:hypothetical protein
MTRRTEETMDWEPPDFTEIEMNAEIGAYQQERGEGSDPDRIAPAHSGVQQAPAEADRPARA